MSNFYGSYYKSTSMCGGGRKDCSLNPLNHSCPSPRHTPHKGTADYQDGSTLSFSNKREQKNKILTINRAMFVKCAEDKSFKRAFAFCMCAKSYIYSSVAKNFKAKQLAQLIGVSERTCRNLIASAIRNGLAETFGERNQHLRFKRLKMDKNNIRLSEKFDLSSYHSTIIALNAATILDIQQRKQFVLQQILTAENPKTSLHKYKSARKTAITQGVHNAMEFADNGCSQDQICRKYHISKRDLQAAIKMAEKKNIFHVHHQYIALAAFDDMNEAKNLMTFIEDGNGEEVLEGFVKESMTNVLRSEGKRAVGRFNRWKEKLKRAKLMFDKHTHQWVIALQTTCEYIKKKVKDTILYSEYLKWEVYTLPNETRGAVLWS